jgi:hypothetical protein
MGRLRGLVAVLSVLTIAACADVWAFRDLTGADGGSAGGVDSSLPDGGGDSSVEGATQQNDATFDAREGLAAPSDVLVDAVTEAEAGPACLTDLSNVGAGDFHIAFTLTATVSGVVLDLLNQGTVCQGSSPAWDVAVGPSGSIEGSTFDGTAIVSLHTTTTVNDGAPHHVVYARTSGVLWASTDGVADNSGVQDDSDLTDMPALQVGAGDPCTTTPLSGHGTLTDLCITTP